MSREETLTTLPPTSEQGAKNTIMHLYVVERESGRRVKEVGVRDEAEAEARFREISAQIGSGFNVNPDDEFNWRDHFFDAGEVWTDPRHPLDD